MRIGAAIQWFIESLDLSVEGAKIIVSVWAAIALTIIAIKI